MDKNYKILILLLVLLFILNYNFLDNKLEEFFIDDDVKLIVRVIDGDTVEVESEEVVRLLGINTPEKGEDYYREAKEFLEGFVLNKSVRLVYGKEKKDMYGRTLAYLFLRDVNVNQKIIENGLGNFYYLSDKDVYFNGFVDVWEKCLERNINLCEKSKNVCADCVLLKELDFIEEKVVLENSCSFACDLDGWTIKDEGRKKFVFENFILKDKVSIIVGESEDSSNVLFWNRKDYVWTDSGDTLFLRDDKNKLVLWENY